MNFLSNLAILILFNDCVIVSLATKEEFKLELLQVIFRHGDRSAEKGEIYKTDPYDDVYKEIGYGQLTRAGKQREYQIGEILRKRYDDFLGDYNSNEVYAFTTDVDRTKMSLDLVLAGLYPPTAATSWSETILWSPIPIHYKVAQHNFLTSYWICSRFADLLKDAEQSSKIQKLFEENENFIKRIENSTELKITRIVTMGFLYRNIRVALNIGLPLPSWCSEEDYKKLEEFAVEMFKVYTATDLMAKMSVGLIVEKLLTNMYNHEEKNDSRKIYLYCTHDHNIADLSNVHNFRNIPEIPGYGSTIVIEKLKGSDGQDYVRIFFWTGESEQWIPLKLDNCNYACPLKRYEKLMGWVLPDNESKECSPSNEEYLTNNTQENKLQLIVDDDLLSFKYGKELYGTDIL